MSEKGVLDSNQNTEIAYMDGGEKYLYKIFKRKNYRDSFDLHRYIKDWASKYHLTVERTAVIHSVQELLDKNSTVLELGAGAGAITWYLAQNFKHVDAVEGSSARSSIIKERTKRYDNVHVTTADITQINYPKEFYQLVTLVGVLEYIPFYSKEDRKTAVSRFLKNLYHTLDKEGILLISIENKLGAKYFSGCREDHNGVLFSGIIDYPFKSPITYSRYELESLLKDAGFENIQFYHLLPDYKLPKIFVRETTEFYDLNPSGIWRGSFNDYSGSRAFLFSDPLFIENTLKSRTFFEFSNSFLVLASKSKNKNLKTRWIFRKYWNEPFIKKEYHHFVDVIKDKNQIKVKKSPLYTNTKKQENEIFEYRLLNQNWVKGTSIYIKALKALFAQDSFKTLHQINNTLLENLVKSFGTGREDLQGYPLVNGEAIDFTYWNLKEDEQGRWHFFDKKWRLKTDITIDFVLFRNLLYLWEDFAPFVQGMTKEQFIFSTIQSIFPKYDIKRFQNHIDIEQTFQSSILG
ncbi:MAG: class I SAM-dependent methyltransferase [Aquificae bacterium]|nr:class I SAM-dependent methyltransferase [Aquificota bacterium]